MVFAIVGLLVILWVVRSVIRGNNEADKVASEAASRRHLAAAQRTDDLHVIAEHYRRQEPKSPSPQPFPGSEPPLHFRIVK